MTRYMVGYCDRCGEATKHRMIECKDSVGWRVFETIVTVGFALVLPREYYCECERCGQINTINK